MKLVSGIVNLINWSDNNMAKVFFYYPDGESSNYSEVNEEINLFYHGIENKKITIRIL